MSSLSSDNEEGPNEEGLPMTQNPYFCDTDGIWIFPPSPRDISNEEEEEEKACEVVDDKDVGAATQGGGNSTSNKFRTDR